MIKTRRTQQESIYWQIWSISKICQRGAFSKGFSKGTQSHPIQSRSRREPEMSTTRGEHPPVIL